VQLDRADALREDLHGGFAIPDLTIEGGHQGPHRWYQEIALAHRWLKQLALVERLVLRVSGEVENELDDFGPGEDRAALFGSGACHLLGCRFQGGRLVEQKRGLEIRVRNSISGHGSLLADILAVFQIWEGGLRFACG
jgi:hypothetical protein